VTPGDDDDSVVTEFSFEEFTGRLGLPPGSAVTSVGMIWFDFNYGSGNNMVRVHYRPGRLAVQRRLVPVPVPLEDRLRKLAAKWRSQSRHPMRRGKPGEAALLTKHADELMHELKDYSAPPGAPLTAVPGAPREMPAAEQEGNHADHQD